MKQSNFLHGEKKIFFIYQVIWKCFKFNLENYIWSNLI